MRHLMCIENEQHRIDTDIDMDTNGERAHDGALGATYARHINGTRVAILAACQITFVPFAGLAELTRCLF